MSDDIVPVSIYLLDDYQPNYITVNNDDVIQNKSANHSSNKPGFTKQEKSLQESLNHINKLAQPRRPYLGGPIRENQKKKTVAFGRTVNVSQCIEGRILKDINQKDMSHSKPVSPTEKMQMNKLPKKRIHETEKNLEYTESLTNKANSKNSPTVTEARILEHEDFIQQIKEQVENTVTEQLRAVGLSSSPSLVNDRNKIANRKERLLRDLENIFKEDPSFVEKVMQLCTNTISRIYKENRGDNRPIIPARMECIKPHSQDKNAYEANPYSENDFQRSPRVIEKLTLERSYQGQPPYSIESATFLQKRSNLTYPVSNYREGTSIVFSEANGPRNVNTNFSYGVPKSNYHPGTSVTIPERNYYVEDVDEFSDVSELNVSNPDISMPEDTISYRANRNSPLNIRKIEERTDKIKNKYKHLLER